jgi:hypothetical protein
MNKSVFFVSDKCVRKVYLFKKIFTDYNEAGPTTFEAGLDHQHLEENTGCETARQQARACIF